MRRFRRSRARARFVVVAALSMGTAAAGVVAVGASGGSSGADGTAAVADSVAAATTTTTWARSGVSAAAGASTTSAPARAATRRVPPATSSAPRGAAVTPATHAAVTATSGAAGHVAGQDGGGTAAPAPPGTSPGTSPPSAVGQQGKGVQRWCNGWITRLPLMSTQMVAVDATGGRLPTAADCANAKAFYDRVKTAAAKYADINVAIADNFRPGADAPGQVPRHYVQWGPSPSVGDPTKPEGLVYKFDPRTGAATLLGVMFSEVPGVPLPQPGGPITVWHYHNKPGAQRMLHVWLFPGAVDPFALMYGDALGRGG